MDYITNTVTTKGVRHAGLQRTPARQPFIFIDGGLLGHCAIARACVIIHTV